MDLNCVAKLQIRRAGNFTEEGIKDVAEWLRHQADWLDKEGTQYADLYTARYNPEDEALEIKE